ncbi:hypothetical protein ABES02_08115 [Neobacillus pocheonensis]|uniref:hypothetical protein n=1 Tax=Neobacillus pocheonensis TaxID=363869 RepID=UPI003D2E6BD5
MEITEGVSEGDTIQLPELTTGSSTSNNQGGMMKGMGGMDGGGMPPSGGGMGAPSGNGKSGN